MAVRLGVEPVREEGAVDRPEQERRPRRRRFGFVRLSRRNDEGRELLSNGQSQPLVLVEDHFALRHLCRA
ncbi:hypothetical protein BAY61_29495 [Prauserella marina]|uniref:Uncharacterized protein n=1 Tax=Prauserella marina TaxID=530584 RepID=A0A222VX27_9PSEU|nr:hypothetical protein [Prauserella marina]ASR38450.1 hypothetical protein BAY61_29495 [Prauserella marina]PWV78307.1 hypothetical protein DES30_10436 [Prauserella marina]SDC83059.1 hypothetical protein SAMN05421630_10436 [Prauserella marina]